MNNYHTFTTHYHDYAKIRCLFNISRADEQMGAFNGTWNDFFGLHKKKKLLYGDYFDHAVGWCNYTKTRPNVLTIFYENLKENHKTGVIEIAKFLGKDIPENIIDAIVEKTSKKTMSENIKTWPGWRDDRTKFVRKAMVGDWVNHFSEDQKKYVDEQAEIHLKPLDIEFTL